MKGDSFHLSLHDDDDDDGVIDIVAVSSWALLTACVLRGISHYTTVIFMATIMFGELYCYEASHDEYTNPPAPGRRGD